MSGGPTLARSYGLIKSQSVTHPFPAEYYIIIAAVILVVARSLVIIVRRNAGEK